MIDKYDPFSHTRTAKIRTYAQQNNKNHQKIMRKHPDFRGGTTSLVPINPHET